MFFICVFVVVFFFVVVVVVVFFYIYVDMLNIFVHCVNVENAPLVYIVFLWLYYVLPIRR